MAVILFVLGIVLAAAGAALIGIGFPINELSRGATLILSGSFALVGGFVLIGLAAVVAEMAKVAALLRARQPASPARAATEPVAAEAVAREALPPAPAEPAPAAPGPTLEVSATAIERLRSSIPRSEKPVPEAVDEVPLSPNGQQVPHTEPRVEPLPRLEPAPRSAGAAAVETREPRLDFLFRPRQARTAQQQESFDALWPKRPARETAPDPREEVARAPAAPATAPAPMSPVAETQSTPQSEPAPAPTDVPPERTVAILKSGVVDGMAYTLYADGSIEAQLPQGTVRFGSIAELRAHIESNS